ncbi:MAG TPA: MBL fold metallo-hydrolase [Gemmatimonadales bacterium]|jgi:glyoxylase-like metal-dependent hydrolase (beta-lactamase superfamily II)
MTTRRDFLAQSASAALALTAAPNILRSFTARTRVAAQSTFAVVPQIGDGVWAVISTPNTGAADARTTLCNGGIIAGKDAVLAIEGFFTPAGSTWVANQCKALTGRWPTHVALTHFHRDHTDGVAGYFAESAKPVLRSTQVTRDETLTKNPTDPDRSTAMSGVVILSGTENTTLDLGGKKVKVVPRIGHTDSDISLELDDQNIVFCGDLFWNNVFPNYVNAIPTKLAQSVKLLRHDNKTVYVPGHGGLGTQADYDRYVSLIGEVEREARDAHQKGVPADSVGNTYTVPTTLIGTPAPKSFLRSAFNAWYRELETK